MPQVLINGKMQTLSFRHNDRYHFVNEWKDVSLVLGVRHEHTHTHRAALQETGARADLVRLNRQASAGG